MLQLPNGRPLLAPPGLVPLVRPGWLSPLVSFSRASGGTYLDASGVLQTAGNNVPRFQGSARRLLIEEARTNSFTNPRAEGAVPGTPGTKPTNWLAPFSNAGLSYQIIGTGTEDGIPYIDIRWYGTATSAGFANVSFSSASVIAAASGQTWTGSVYLRLVGGTLNGISSMDVQLTENNNTGSWLAATFNTITVNTGSLSGQRKIATRTFNQASTAYTNFYPSIYVVNGAAIDVTLRVGTAQLEQGAFATSLILPPVGSPAATTRLADSATMSRGINPLAGIVLTKAMFPNSNPANYPAVFSISDGTTNNRIAAYQTAGANVFVPAVTVGGSVTSSYVQTSSFTPGSPFRVGVTWNGASISITKDGAAALTSALSGDLPAGVSRLDIGWNSGQIPNGEFESFDYIPGVWVPPAQLQALVSAIP